MKNTNAERRIRSTCHKFTIHVAHYWEQGDAKLWCPGTDGSNPQVPKKLGDALKEIYK